MNSPDPNRARAMSYATLMADYIVSMPFPLSTAIPAHPNNRSVGNALWDGSRCLDCGLMTYATLKARSPLRGRQVMMGNGYPYRQLRLKP